MTILAVLYFVLACLLLASTLAAIFPRALRPSPASLLFFAAMVVVFYIPQWILLGGLITALMAYTGALRHWAGQAGLGVHVVSWALLVFHLWQMSSALPELDDATVADADHPFTDGLTDEDRRQLEPGRVVWGPSLIYRIPEMLRVAVTRNVVFREVGGVKLRLDVYRPRDAAVSAAVHPAVVYMHGGGWVFGTRRQSRFMMYELAAAGWVVFAISYRFAPRYPLPAAVEDCKAAVAWIRAHAAEYGANGDNIVAVGGSAGGHLAAMLALTANMPRFQPGFEAADTRVQGAVVFYGVADFVSAFTDRPHPALAGLLERVVVRSRFRDNPELFRAVQPVTHVSADAPPILLVHGTHDHLVPFGESHVFAERLRTAGARRVHLLMVPRGQHAFEIVPSPLHQRAVRVVIRFMATLRDQPISAASSALSRRVAG